VDLTNLSLTVRTALQGVGEQLVVVEPKTKKSRRHPGVKREAADEMEALLGS
jgi:hypothetical protein